MIQSSSYSSLSGDNVTKVSSKGTISGKNIASLSIVTDMDDQLHVGFNDDESIRSGWLSNAPTVPPTAVATLSSCMSQMFKTLGMESDSELTFEGTDGDRVVTTRKVLDLMKNKSEVC
jgi:hypothetical protein